MTNKAAAPRRKLNIMLLVLLALALAALVVVLCLRGRAADGAVSSDNRVETAPLSLTLDSASLRSVFTAAPLSSGLSLPAGTAPFTVDNMFPGDQETKTFTVTVRHRRKADLHFEARLVQNDDVDDATYRKLSDGLHIRVLRGSDTVYDGPFSGLCDPGTLNTYVPVEVYTVTGASPTDVFYTVTVSLPETAGNEFQNKALILDLKWWMEKETTGGGGTVIVTPDEVKTGDSFSMPLMLAAAAAAAVGAVAVLLLGAKRRKEARHDQD